MREEGAYDVETFRTRLREVNDEIALIQAAVDRPRAFSDLDIEEVLAAARWFANNLSETWLNVQSTASRARFERLTFPQGLRGFRDGTIRTIEPGLFLALSEASNAQQSLEVHPMRISSNLLYEYFSELLKFFHEMVGTFKYNRKRKRAG
jgi:hypothetical protein